MPFGQAYILVLGGGLCMDVCATSLPILAIGILYVFEVSARCGGGKRLESSVCKEGMCTGIV